MRGPAPSSGSASPAATSPRVCGPCTFARALLLLPPTPQCLNTHGDAGDDYGDLVSWLDDSITAVGRRVAPAASADPPSHLHGIARVRWLAPSLPPGDSLVLVHNSVDVTLPPAGAFCEANSAVPALFRDIVRSATVRELRALAQRGGSGGGGFLCGDAALAGLAPPGCGEASVDAAARGWRAGGGVSEPSPDALLVWRVLCDAAQLGRSRPGADDAPAVHEVHNCTSCDEQFHERLRCGAPLLRALLAELPAPAADAAAEVCAWLTLCVLCGAAVSTDGTSPAAALPYARRGLALLHAVSACEPLAARLAATVAWSGAAKMPPPWLLGAVPPASYLWRLIDFGFARVQPALRLAHCTLLGVLLSPSVLPVAEGAPSPVLAQFLPREGAGAGGGVRDALLPLVSDVEAARTPLRAAARALREGVGSWVDAWLLGERRVRDEQWGARAAVAQWARDVLRTAENVRSSSAPAAPGLLLELALLLAHLSEPLSGGAVPLLLPRSNGEGWRAGHPSDKLALVDVGGVIRRTVQLQREQQPEPLQLDAAFAVTASTAPVAPTSTAAAPRSVAAGFFLLALDALRCGACPLIAAARRDQDARGRLYAEMDKAAAGALPNTPPSAALADLRTRYSRLVANMLASDTARLDPTVLAPLLRFSVLALEWLCRCCAGAVQLPGVGGSPPPQVPFPMRPPAAAALLPESLLASVLDFCAHIATAEDDLTTAPLSQPVFDLACYGGAARPLCSEDSTDAASPAFVRARGSLPRALAEGLVAVLTSHRGYARVPLRCAAADALYMFLRPSQRVSRVRGAARAAGDVYDAAAHTFSADPSVFVAARASAAVLLAFGDAPVDADRPARMQRLVDVARVLWSAPRHGALAFARIADEGDSAVDGAVRGLLGHVAEVFFAAFRELEAVRVLEADLPLGAPPAATRNHAEAASHLAALNASLPLLSNVLSVQRIAEAALRSPTLCGSLAATLLDAALRLGGERARALKVRDPRALGFDPRALLAAVAAAHCALAAPGDAWPVALATAGFSAPQQSGWAAFVACVVRVGVRSHEDAAPLRALGLAAAGQGSDEDEACAEAPEELTCPMSGALLLNAVRLPAYTDDKGTEHEGSVYDRAWVEAYVADVGANGRAPLDPANNQPLDTATLTRDDGKCAAAAAFLEQWRAAKAAAGRDADGAAGGMT